MLSEIIAGAALALAGWTLREAAKVEPIQDDVKEVKDEVKYIRGRVDAVYDHLVTDRGRSHKG